MTWKNEGREPNTRLGACLPVLNLSFTPMFHLLRLFRMFTPAVILCGNVRESERNKTVLQDVCLWGMTFTSVALRFHIEVNNLLIKHKKTKGKSANGSEILCGDFFSSGWSARPTNFLALWALKELKSNLFSVF